MYDLQGNHVGDIGRFGQGPGEYQMPWALGISSTDGTIFIREAFALFLFLGAPIAIIFLAFIPWPIEEDLRLEQQALERIRERK